MLDPQKVRIAEAAVSLLEEVTRSNGFWTDFGKRVSRRRSGLAELNASNFPAAFVYWLPGGTTEVECIGAAQYRTVAVLIVEGLVRREDIFDEVIRFEGDCYKALLALPATLSNTCEAIEPTGWRADWMEQTDFDRGVSRVAFDVTYTWTADDP